MPKPIEAVLIGAGQRGTEIFGAVAKQFPDELRFVAVAEPNMQRRESFALAHNIPAKFQFTSWESLFDAGVDARAAFICTQDQLHTQPALAALSDGYDVLLEKPMATTEAECRRLVAAADEMGKQLHIAHVLRYTEHFKKIYEFLRAGIVGEIIHINHAENVSWWHMAHSYVRGNWRNEASSSPMILAKCCHDLDIIYWLAGKKCKSLSSFGGLKHFCPENAPNGVPDYCLEGCPVEDSCPFYAPWVYVGLEPTLRSLRDTSNRKFEQFGVNLYLQNPELVKMLGSLVEPLRELSEYKGWPISVLSENPTPENILDVLKNGPYGRCVYRCDNDVVDHQVVLLNFESGLTATLTMHGFSHLEGRTTRIQGSKAELRAFIGLGGGWIEVDEHRSDQHIHVETATTSNQGHGGGDVALTRAFVKSLQEGNQQATTLAQFALPSHLLAFNAEKSRKQGIVIQNPAD